MILGTIKRKLSSITAKLFLSFWLITIVSIATTRIISTQLSDDALLLPAHKDDLRQLYRMQNQITNRQVTDISKILIPPPRLQHKRVLLKDTSTNEIFAKPSQRISSLQDYLGKNNFTNTVSVQFPYARLTGPLLISVSGNNYQLYLASYDKDRPFGMFFMQLPPWVRISIPLVVSFTFCWFLARSFSRPLLTIQKAAAQLGEGKLDTRVPISHKRNDELGSLAKSFNTMAEKLEANHSAHKRLLADVSHELRSPMTRLQMAVALAQKASEKPEELTRHLRRCEKEVTTLDTMISDVLALSRFENTLTTLQKENFDLKEILTLLIQDGQFMANEKSITITAVNIPIIEINGDSQLFASAFNNVLINAIKYSEQDSKIYIRFELSNAWLNIEVVDSGPGVPEESLDSLFKPFYRVNDARDRNTGGTGLGLAIARQAIEAHNGSIFAENNVNAAGLTVTIKLPIGTI